MINGVGNLLSFADNNVSHNNQLESYKDNSFAEMLNKAQNENINLENPANKSVNMENYNNKDDYNKYSEARENERISDNNDNLKTESVKEKFADEKNIDNEKAKSSLNSLEDSANQTEENSDNKEFLSENEKKIESLKEKAKKLQNIIKNEENNGLFVKNSKISKKTEKENIIKEINNLKKEIENLESKELSDNEKEDLSILSASLENIKNILFENAKEIKENIIKKEELKNINDLKTKDLEQRNQKEIKENIKDAEINKNTEINADYKDNFKDNFNLENNIENKLNKRENKIENLNSNGNLNRSISEDKGAELTIINMKDSPEGANLKGFNHYNNNVSKTQSGLAENMIKFQDLMGKLVEKAQVAINNGKSEVLMSINPEYLGKVRLKISMDGDNFVGKIFVDNAEIKDIFTKNLDTVITSLNEIGINIEGFDVMLKQDMPNGEFAEFDDNNPFKGFANEVEDFAEEVKADIRNYIIPERKLNLLI